MICMSLQTLRSPPQVTVNRLDPFRGQSALCMVPLFFYRCNILGLRFGFHPPSPFRRSSFIFSHQAYLVHPPSPQQQGIWGSHWENICSDIRRDTCNSKIKLGVVWGWHHSSGSYSYLQIVILTNTDAPHCLRLYSPPTLHLREYLRRDRDSQLIGPDA